MLESQILNHNLTLICNIFLHEEMSLTMIGYAVIDTETTGLNRFHNDRLIEVGVVLLNTSLLVEGTYTTVVNPHRDLGATNIHHLQGITCENAPSFKDIDETLLALLTDRVIVAQNAPFDARFLSLEFEKIGKVFDFYEHCIDTVTLLKQSKVYRGRDNKLETACRFYNIQNANAHSALSDAIATAELFLKLVQESSQLSNAIRTIPPVPFMPSPNSKISLNNWLSREVIQAQIVEQSRLKPYIEGLPVKSKAESKDIPTPVVTGYLTQMHKQLVNGSYLPPQTQAIENLIRANSLSREQVIDLHEEYVFMRLCGFYAVHNNQLIDSYARRINELADYLQVTPTNRDYLIRQTLVESQFIIPKAQELNRYFMLNSGDEVVLTGEDWTTSKEELSELFLNAGIRSTGSVSRKIKAVVCNDPYSLSNKAEKARDLGIPSLSEQTVSELTGIDMAQ